MFSAEEYDYLKEHVTEGFRYLVRDESGKLNLFNAMPTRDNGRWKVNNAYRVKRLKPGIMRRNGQVVKAPAFAFVTWESEPIDLFHEYHLKGLFGRVTVPLLVIEWLEKLNYRADRAWAQVLKGTAPKDVLYWYNHDQSSVYKLGQALANGAHPYYDEPYYWIELVDEDGVKMTMYHFISVEGEPVISMRWFASTKYDDHLFWVPERVLRNSETYDFKQLKRYAKRVN